VLLASPLAARSHAGGNGKLRIGLVGCGGRGTGAALNALRTHPENVLVAMGDAFTDHLENKLSYLQKDQRCGAQVQVDHAHRFVGFDAYKKVIDSADVVLLCATPHFRPRHLAYAVDKGKHIFAEKPCATDGPGIRSVAETVEKARKKKLNLVAGLCYRYHEPKVETMQRVHDGAIGDIVTVQATYHASQLWHRGKKPDWSEMEYQIRNWLYFNWLSGDGITEQHIHSLDKVAWVLNDFPTAVTASGGRSQRTQEKFGNIYDHFSTVYEFKGGQKAFCSWRQWDGSARDVSDFAYGTRGMAALQGHWIKAGGGDWKFPRGQKHRGMYDEEHVALFDAIRGKRPVINNGDYLWKSTLMAIMGRMSAYTGKRLTWEQAFNSKENLAPETYAWGDAPECKVAIPGVTEFV
jgi:predicted dehydrogenase